MGRIFRLTDDPPNELRGFSYAYVSNSGENKRICCCIMEPTFQALSFKQNAV